MAKWSWSFGCSSRTWCAARRTTTRSPSTRGKLAWPSQRRLQLAVEQGDLDDRRIAHDRRPIGQRVRRHRYERDSATAGSTIGLSADAHTRSNRWRCDDQTSARIEYANWPSMATAQSIIRRTAPRLTTISFNASACSPPCPRASNASTRAFPRRCRRRASLQARFPCQRARYR